MLSGDEFYDDDITSGRFDEECEGHDVDIPQPDGSEITVVMLCSNTPCKRY